MSTRDRIQGWCTRLRHLQMSTWISNRINRATAAAASMNQTPCCFGLTDVRVCSRIIACVQLVIQIVFLILLMFCIFLCFTSNITKTLSTANFLNQLQSDISLFALISCTILLIYSNYYLREATYVHNLQYINLWLIVNTVDVFMSILFTIFITWRTGYFILFFIGILGCLVYSYKVYIVYQFYTDEISCTPKLVHITPMTINGIKNEVVETSHQNHIVNEIETETRTINNHF